MYWSLYANVGAVRSRTEEEGPPPHFSGQAALGGATTRGRDSLERAGSGAAGSIFIDFTGALTAL